MDASHLPSNINRLSVNNNSQSSSPLNYLLVHQSETTLIYRCGEEGIKVHIDPNQNRDEILELLKLEQNVSRNLPSSCLQRKVLRLGFYHDFPAVYFEWVEGVTVEEWLRCDAEGEQPPPFATRLQVALAITKAVCDFHEAKLFHCNLSLDNIILDFSGGTENNCSAVLIDYSKSALLLDTFFNTHDEPTRHAFIESKNQKDLYDLGSILYSVLSIYIPDPNLEQGGDEDGSEDGIEEQRNKRGKIQQLQPSNDFPLYLLSLVTALLAHQYKSSREVFLDLQLAMKKPHVYLQVHNCTDLATLPLMLPQDSFYGRRAELSMLQHSFNSMMKGDNVSHALVVTGHAGAGKTTLLSQLNKQLKQSNGSMIVCKFNQNDLSDTILASGFDSFFHYILGSGNNIVKKDLKIRIEKALGEHVVALVDCLPHLAVLLGRHDVVVNDNNDTPALKLRWKFLLSNLVRAISSQSHPIALLFEDLHWASDDTLDTIQLIMTDAKIRHCLFCMSYRDAEAGPKLLNMNEGLQSRGVILLSIRLGPIEKESVDDLVSEALCMPPTITRPLSAVICKKTGGTILFVTSLLKSLHEEKLICFNLTTLRYEFDLENIILKEISNDVLDFLKNRMSRLPESIQNSLKIAACLGSTFDLSVFQKANKAPINVTNDFISFSTENGYLQELSPSNEGSNRNHQTKFKWSHDQLHSAAYSLIPTNMRESTHLLVGTRIYLSTESGELTSMIHDIVGNMNRGVRHLRTQDQQTQLAELNLVAGEQSKKSSAFYSALKYFNTGIDLLEDDWQNTSYDLGMKLFNSATHMMILTGNITAFESTIVKPLSLANNAVDRLPAHLNFVRFLSLSGRFEESADKCFVILSENGEDFPSQVTPQIIRAEIIKTELLMANLPNENLDSLLPLTDPVKFSIMEIMVVLILLLFQTELQYVPLVGCRLIQLSFSHGWCFYSAFGLYSYGQTLMNGKKIDEGYFLVKMGLRLLKQFNETGNTKGYLPVLETIFYAQIAIWKEPLQAACESLIGIYKDAVMEGQIAVAMGGALQSCRQGFFCGSKLAALSNMCTSFENDMAHVKQMSSIMGLISHHCMIKKLMGQTDVSQVFAIFNGALTNEDELLEHVLSKGDQTLVQAIYFNRLFLAFWFKNYDEVVQLSELYGNSQMMRLLDIYHVFYEGLAALRLAQKKDDDGQKLISVGEKAISKFQSWEHQNNWTFENKTLLLSAELCYARGNYEAAEEKYKASIVSAQNHKFVHEEGLAYEFLGSFYFCSGKTERSKEMLANAITCYETWGAIAVIDQINNQRHMLSS